MSLTSALAAARAQDENVGEPARVFDGWEIIGPAACPILARRTLLTRRLLKVCWHVFLPNAADRDPHDHPRSFVTVVLRGGYRDVSPCPTCRSSEKPGWLLGPPSDDWRAAREMTPCPDCRLTGRIVEDVQAPAIVYRPARHAHITEIGPLGATTLCLFGPPRREWGFWRLGQWFDWREYERRFGLAFCCDREDS